MVSSVAVLVQLHAAHASVVTTCSLYYRLAMYGVWLLFPWELSETPVLVLHIASTSLLMWLATFTLRRQPFASFWPLYSNCATVALLSESMHPDSYRQRRMEGGGSLALSGNSYFVCVCSARICVHALTE